MQTYWDFTPRERADMSREMVERFLDAELMTKGVLKVKPPELEPEPETASLPTKTFYAIEHNLGYRQSIGIVFDSAEAARACLDLKPLFKNSVYCKGESIEYVAPMVDARVASISLACEASVMANKAAMEQASAVRALNEQRKNEYVRQSREMEKVLSGVWDDWACQRDAQAAHKRVVETYDEYKRMAGEETVAAAFLAKVFTEDKINDAFDWFGLPSPVREPGAVPA